MEWLVKDAQLTAHLKIVFSRRNPSSATWTVRFLEGRIEKRIFIKHHSEEKMYRREKSTLVLLRPHARSDERYAVPEILAWSDELRLIAITWLEGEPVSDGLRSAVGRNASLEELNRTTDLAYEVGRWLHHFEKRTSGRQYGLFPSEEILCRIRELNELIRSSGLRRFDARLATAIEAYVTQSIGLMSDKYEYSSIHRDFSFQHIWKNNNRIVVIDFGRCIEGPRGRDAAQFYLRLGDLSVFNPMVSSPKVHKLQVAFSLGYGRLDVDAPHIKVYMILSRLEQLGALVEQARTGFVAKSLMTVHAHAHLRWLRDRLEE
jgi:hypothetical protein